mgnify:CR=1 FL=1
MYAPTAAEKALIGVVDGTYSVTFDPNKSESFALGPNHLDIPAGAVCDLLTSGSGTPSRDTPCHPEPPPVTAPNTW